jgi:hypothetical protein
MSEGSEDAAILIATSHQALKRIDKGLQDTLITDCTVVILFAGFYVEATLNYILEFTGRKSEMSAFPLAKDKPYGKNQPGMKDKLGWFYNAFVEETPFSNWADLREGGINAKLDEKFPGFDKIHSFRNDISHGRINGAAKSLETTRKLRQQAKDLVTQLYNITALGGVFCTPPHNI